MKVHRKSLDALLSTASEAIIQRIKMGDRIERARPIRHTVLFPRRSEASDWIARMRDDGYQISVERLGFGGSRVVATTESALEPQLVDEFVTRMHVQATGAGGYYQGWDGPLILGDEERA